MKRKVEVKSRRIGGTVLVVGQGEGEGVGLGEGAGTPCPTQQVPPSPTRPQSAAALQSAALEGSGRSPVSFASKGGVA